MGVGEAGGVVPPATDQLAQDVEVDVLELVDVQAPLADAVLAELLEQVGVAAVEGEPVQREGRLAGAEPHAAHLTGVPGGVRVAQVPEADDGGAPQAGLRAGLLPEDLEQFQPLRAAAGWFDGVQVLEHGVVRRLGLGLVRHGAQPTVSGELVAPPPVELVETSPVELGAAKRERSDQTSNTCPNIVGGGL